MVVHLHFRVRVHFQLRTLNKKNDGDKLMPIENVRKCLCGEAEVGRALPVNPFRLCARWNRASPSRSSALPRVIGRDGVTQRKDRRVLFPSGTSTLDDAEVVVYLLDEMRKLRVRRGVVAVVWSMFVIPKLHS